MIFFENYKSFIAPWNAKKTWKKKLQLLGLGLLLLGTKKFFGLRKFWASIVEDSGLGKITSLRPFVVTVKHNLLNFYEQQVPTIKHAFINDTYIIELSVTISSFTGFFFVSSERQAFKRLKYNKIIKLLSKENVGK